MEKTFLIPLDPEAQAFTIRLAGADYRLVVRWRDVPASVNQPGGWFMDVLSGDDETPLACGVPLTTGTDLVKQLEYLGIGGELFIITDGDAGAVPLLETLGTESKLYFITEVSAS